MIFHVNKTVRPWLMSVAFAMFAPAFVFSQEQEATDTLKEEGTFRFSPGYEPKSTEFDDEFPKDAVWFNADFPLNYQAFVNKGLLVVVWHPSCIDALSFVQRAQEFVTRNPYIQMISVVPGNKEYPFTGQEIREFIQVSGINHPVAVVNDLSTFKSIDSAHLPWAMLYQKSKTPELKVNSPSALLEVQKMMEQWMTDTAILNSFSPWQAKPTMDPMRFADPVIELPVALSSSSGGEVIVLEPAHHKAIIVSGDGTGRMSFGNGLPGYADGTGFNTQLRNPTGAAFSASSGEVYIADPGNHRIRVGDATNFLMYTLLGNGKSSEARLDSVKGALTSVGLPIDVELIGKKLYVLSAASNQLIEVEPVLGYGKAVVDFPMDRWVDNCRVYAMKIAPASKGLYVVMSDGSVWECLRGESGGTKAWASKEIYRPADRMKGATAVCEYKGKVFATLGRMNAVGTLQKGEMKVFSGNGERGWADGSAKDAKYNQPSDITVLNGRLLVADYGNHLLRSLHPKKATVRTIGFEPTFEMINTGDALATGDQVYLEPLIVNDGENSFEVKIDLQGWAMVPGTRNEVHSEVYGGIGLESEELSEPSFRCSFSPEANEGFVQFEIYLTLRSPECPELVVHKKTLLAFEVQIIPGEASAHELLYVPKILPQ